MFSSANPVILHHGQCNQSEQEYNMHKSTITPSMNAIA